MPDVSKKITGEVVISAAKFSQLQKRSRNIAGFKERITASLRKEVTGILETILGGAIVLEASDIHVEPLEKKAKIRSRVDGILQDVLFI
jgi:type II secretory ATPase GspE/PulE/Tfp pilus assembly ATPase PilB-like protein